jgi:hypothetical protein
MEHWKEQKYIFRPFVRIWEKEKHPTKSAARLLGLVTFWGSHDWSFLVTFGWFLVTFKILLKKFINKLITYFKPVKW